MEEAYADEFPGEVENALTASYGLPPVADEYYDVDGTRKSVLSSSEEGYTEGESVEEGDAEESIAGEYANFSKRVKPGKRQPRAVGGHRGDSGACMAETHPAGSEASGDCGEEEDSGEVMWPVRNGLLTPTIRSRAGQSYVIPGGDRSLATIERSPQCQSLLDKTGALMGPVGAESAIISHKLHCSSSSSASREQPSRPRSAASEEVALDLGAGEDSDSESWRQSDLLPNAIKGHGPATNMKSCAPMQALR